MGKVGSPKSLCLARAGLWLCLCHLGGLLGPEPGHDPLPGPWPWPWPGLARVELVQVEADQAAASN